jgi:hypothetical protein
VHYHVYKSQPLVLSLINLAHFLASHDLQDPCYCYLPVYAQISEVASTFYTSQLKSSMHFISFVRATCSTNLILDLIALIIFREAKRANEVWTNNWFFYTVIRLLFVVIFGAV